VSEKRTGKAAKRAARKDAARRKREARVHRDAQGRAHLVVERDASGRTLRLGLARPLFNEDWQNQVAAAAASTADAMLAEDRTPRTAAAIGRNAMTATSKIAEGALALDPAHPPACRPGCAHCCHQAVGVVAPEALAIHEHLRSTRTPGELEAVVLRIRTADDRTRGLTSAERQSPDLPCPFLEEDRCSIYEVRPLACRGTNSLDAGACERSPRDPDARAELLAGKQSLPCYLEPIRAFHAVTAGLQLGLAELHGLRMLPLELTAAMRILVDEPESVPQRWLAGEDPFAPARGGDVTNDASIRRLAGTRDAKR